MDLRFYRTGTVARRPRSTPTDVDGHRRPAGAARSRRKSMWPANCPTRTGRTASCAEAVFEAVRRVRREARRGGVALRGVAVPGGVGGVGAARDRDAWCRWGRRDVGAQEAGDLPTPVAEGPGDVSRAAATGASSGSGPRTATWRRRRCTTRWGCRSTTRWRRSCSGGSEFTSPPRRVRMSECRRYEGYRCQRFCDPRRRWAICCAG